MHYYIGPIQIYSGAEVSGHFGTLRHYNLVPKCPGAVVSREPSVDVLLGSSRTSLQVLVLYSDLKSFSLSSYPWTAKSSKIAEDSAFCRQSVSLLCMIIIRVRPIQTLGTSWRIETSVNRSHRAPIPMLLKSVHMLQMAKHSIPRRMNDRSRIA